MTLDTSVKLVYSELFKLNLWCHGGATGMPHPTCLGGTGMSRLARLARLAMSPSPSAPWNPSAWMRRTLRQTINIKTRKVPAVT